VGSYVLDTNIGLLLARGGELGVEIARRYELMQAGVMPIISIVTHGELWVLARRNRWGQGKREALQLLIDNSVTIPITQDIVDAYVKIDVVSASAVGGAVNMGKNDLWIAATDRDFNHLHGNGVEVEYIDPQRRGRPPPPH
jgi:tRNA(fMet)-specific endonuclease VapC